MFVRRATFILALTLGLLPSSGAQVESGITVTDVTERQTATLAIRLVNASSSTREVQYQLALPVGWEALIPPRLLTLAPTEASVEVIVVRVPRSAAAGIHPVTVTVDGVRTEVGVRVPRRDALSLRGLSASAANGQAQATFQVRNDGNTGAGVVLTAVGQGSPRVTPETLTLAPGETREVEVTGPALPQLAKYSVTLLARTAEVTAQASLSSPVLTPAPDARSAWHTLPAEVQLEAGPAGTRIRLSAEGTLAPGVNVRLRAEPGVLEAELRIPGAHLALGPATPGFSSFGVRSPALAIQGELGDSKVGSPSLRAYFGVRRDLQGQPVAGIELAQRYGWGEARIGIDASSEGATATLAVRAATPQTTAQGELGIRRDGMALAVSADTALKDNSLNLTRVGGGVRYRAPGFEGVPSGRVDAEVRTLAQGKDFSVGASLRGAAEFSAGHHIAGKDAEFGVWAQSFRPPSSQRPASQVSLRTGLKWTERSDRQETTLTAHLGASQQFGWGQLEQEVTNEQASQAGTRTVNDLRYAVSAAYPFAKGLNTFMLKPKVAVTFDLLKSTSRVGASISGSWSGQNGTRGGVSISQPNFSQRELYLSADVEHLLANGTTLLASVSQSFGPVPNTALRVAARIPFAVPVYLRPEIGSLEGRVLDQQGKGLAGMTVQVRSYLAVTDMQGVYHFPALPRGDYLVVPHAPKGQWCTPPGTAVVFGRQTTQHDLTCVPAVQITAQLVVHAPGESAEIPLEVPDVRVSLSGPLGRFGATSDRSGRLSFEALPAGTYRLEITPAGPTQLKNLIVEAPATVDLAAGAAQLTLRFGRKLRVVQMQQEEPVVVPSPPSVPTAPATTSLGVPR